MDDKEKQLRAENDAKQLLASRYELHCNATHSAHTFGDGVIFRDGGLERVLKVLDDGRETIILERKADGSPRRCIREQVRDPVYETVPVQVLAPEYVSRALEAYPLTDLGCGFEFLSAHYFAGLGAKTLIGVDPYHTPYEQHIEGVDVRSAGADGLGYLLSQADESTNVFTSFIDDFILSSEYAKALAEEIFRVVPENGVYLSRGSEGLSHYAARLFPYGARVTLDEWVLDKYSGVVAFSKNPIGGLACE